MAAGDAYSVSNVSELFKVKYGKKSENVFNTATVTLARIKRDQSFGGRQMELPVPFSFNGGVGSGTSLPTSNVQDYQTATITRKKMYAKVLIDREAIKASMNNEVAFEKATENQVKAGVLSFSNNVNRALFAIENGMLGQGDNATNVTGLGTTVSPYVVRMAAASYVSAFWQEQQLVNVGAETTLLEVVAVNDATRDISFVGTSATLAAASAGPTATNAKIYVQNSNGNDIQSIYGALVQTSSSLYGINIARRWKAYQQLSVASPISVDLINDLVLGVEKQCGQIPNLAICSFKQYRNLLNLLEDQKRYMIVQPRDKKYQGVISFNGLEIMTSGGAIPVFPERHCPDDTFMVLNDNFIELHSAGAPSWADEDGAVLSRSTTADAFEARYCMYGQLYIPPSFHGIATGLT